MGRRRKRGLPKPTRQHRWHRRGENEIYDGQRAGAEHRICSGCRRVQYCYGTTSGQLLFWLPEVPETCHMSRDNSQLTVPRET